MIAELLPNAFGLALVLLGRFAQGLGTGGAQAIQPSYLAAVLPLKDITPTIVILNAAASLGFVVGPAFGVLFSWLPSLDLGIGLHFTELTGPGYLVLLCGLFIVLLYTAVFDEEGDRASAAQNSSAKTGSLLEEGKLDQQPPHVHNGERDYLSESSLSAVETEPLLPVMESPIGVGQTPHDDERIEGGFKLTYGLLICNIVMFVQFSGFVVQETVTTPLIEKLYGWSVFHATMLFTFGSLFALGATIMVLKLSSRFSDRGMVLFSIGLGAVGYASLMYTKEAPISKVRFLGGFAVISVVFPIGRAITMALYTKLLPLGGQGTGQGIILAVGAVARIVGPLCAIRALLMEEGGLILFGITGLLFAVCAVVVLTGYRGLVVETSERKEKGNGSGYSVREVL